MFAVFLEPPITCLLPTNIFLLSVAKDGIKVVVWAISVFLGMPHYTVDIHVIKLQFPFSLVNLSFITGRDLSQNLPRKEDEKITFLPISPTPRAAPGPAWKVFITHPCNWCCSPALQVSKLLSPGPSCSQALVKQSFWQWWSLIKSY